MALSFPTLAQIESTVLAIWQSIRPDADSGLYSDLWLQSKVTSRLVMPHTTYGVYLDAWLYIVGSTDGAGGYGRIEASTSTATDCATVVTTDTVAANSLVGQQLTDDGGRVYQINGSHSGTVGAGSITDLDIVSVSTGLATNLESGATLEWISTPANCADTVTLTADLDGGSDRETDSEGRARLLRKLQTPPLSANTAEMREVCENALPGSIRAYVYPQRQNSPDGYGLVDFTVLQTGETAANRIVAASSTIETLVEAEILDKLPVQIWLGYRMIPAVEEDTGGSYIEIEYTLKPTAPASSATDFDSKTLNAEVNTTVPANYEVQCDVPVNVYMESGDRVIIDNIEATVDKVGVADGVITSGGGLATGLLAAIKTYVDTLGPERGTYADAVDYWEDTLRSNYVAQAALESSDDILDISVIDLGTKGGGSGNYAPTASVGTTVKLITYGEIVIHEAK
jgi:hypothetical protein